MSRAGKRARANREVAGSTRLASLEEAARTVRGTANAKFDETVDIAVQLGIDPRKSDQMVRGSVQLPEGSGRTVRIAVCADADRHDEARAAGADRVGLDDLVESVGKGEIDFDVLVATPGAMRALSKVAKVLGPKGLMPNPKSGTVDDDVGAAVERLKKGQVQFRNDKAGIVHLPIGKASFSEEALVRNARSVIDALVRAKPSASKGVYLRKASLSSSMGPGVAVDVAPLR